MHSYYVTTMYNHFQPQRGVGRFQNLNCFHFPQIFICYFSNAHICQLLINIHNYFYFLSHLYVSFFLWIDVFTSTCNVSIDLMCSHLRNMLINYLYLTQFLRSPTENGQKVPVFTNLKCFYSSFNFNEDFNKMLTSQSVIYEPIK